MAIKVTLKDTLTKTTSIFIDEYSQEEKLEDSFMWTEGNYSCDCNRSIFFFGHIDESLGWQARKTNKSDLWEITKNEQTINNTSFYNINSPTLSILC